MSTQRKLTPSIEYHYIPQYVPHLAEEICVTLRFLSLKLEGVSAEVMQRNRWGGLRWALFKIEENELFVAGAGADGKGSGR